MKIKGNVVGCPLKCPKLFLREEFSMFYVLRVSVFLDANSQLASSQFCELRVPSTRSPKIRVKSHKLAAHNSQTSFVWTPYSMAVIGCARKTKGW